jgi:hypothetical protein
MPVRTTIICVLLAAAVAGCGGGKGNGDGKYAAPEAPQPASGAVPWPAPPNPVELTTRAGLVPERAEFLQYHVHAHLDVFVNGKAVRVPSGIGINLDDPAVQREKLADGTFAYGGISPPCTKPCISPLHTHDDSGVLHTESKTATPNRLGQLFTEWDVKLDKQCVGGYCAPDAATAIFVNGEKYEGDPREIELSDQKEIAIAIGSPPSTIPSVFPVG